MPRGAKRGIVSIAWETACHGYNERSVLTGRCAVYWPAARRSDMEIFSNFSLVALERNIDRPRAETERRFCAHPRSAHLDQRTGATAICPVGRRWRAASGKQRAKLRRGLFGEPPQSSVERH